VKEIMLQIQQITPGSEQYPKDPILSRGSETKKVLCFGNFVSAIAFAQADRMSSSSFAIFEKYATPCNSLTEVVAINYFILDNLAVCEFNQNKGDRYSLFTCEWRSKHDKTFIETIQKYYPSYVHLIKG